MAGQRVDAPTAAELEWVQAGVAAVRALADGHGSADAPLDPPLLDEVYAAWRTGWDQAPSAERDDPNPYVNAFGVAFGQTLADGLGFEWAVVTDDYGTEIAVQRQPGDVLVFPPNLVGKRFETGETGFFVPVYAEIEELVGTLPET